MELFSEGEVEFPTDLENIISPCITVEENAELSRIPTQAEIKDMLFQMEAQKASGPNRLPVLFYKKYWKFVGDTVISVVTNLF